MNKKLIGLALIISLTISLGTAQTGDFGDYALTEEVDSYDTVDPQTAIELESIEDENVTVEVINDGSVVDTVEDVEINSDGIGDVELSEAEDVTQLAIYPSDTDVEEVSTVTHYYDYDGTTDGELDTENYDSNTEYTDITAYDSEGEEIEEDPMSIITEILPWLVIVVVIGGLFESLNRNN